MALQINLYHEILRTKKQEQYDPLKLSIFGLIFVAVGLVTWYFIEFGTKSSAVSSYESKQAEFASLDPKEKEAKIREGDLTKQLAVTEKLGARIEERFYWAPVLQEVALAVPENIQITKLVAEVSGETLRKCQMTIEGIAAGDEPRAAAEDFRTALVNRLSKQYRNTAATFKTLDDSTDLVNLNGQSLRTATFNISVIFNSGTEPPPPVPQRTPRTRKTVALQNP